MMHCFLHMIPQRKCFLPILGLLCGFPSQSAASRNSMVSETRNQITFTRNCSPSERTSAISFEEAYEKMNESTLSTSQIEFSFIAELSTFDESAYASVNDDNKYGNSDEQCVLNDLEQMILDTAAEAILACTTTNSLAAEDGPFDDVIVALSIQSSLSRVNTSDSTSYYHT